MFVIKEIVSVELLSKLDQLIYREANDRNGGLGTLLRGDGMWCLAPKCEDQTVRERKHFLHCLKNPDGTQRAHTSFGALAAHLKQRAHG